MYSVGLMTGDSGAGKGPVRIVKQSTSVTSGVAVTQKLVKASVAFGNLLSGTFGPNGLDKMMYKTTGEASITNDGAKIVAELLVRHPAAKAFVSLAESQENACGDGVTSCLLFASELMREGGRLLSRGVHPLILIEGYTAAHEIALNLLEEKRIDFTGFDRDALLKVAKTSLSGTIADFEDDFLAKMVVDAVETIRFLEGKEVFAPYTNVRMSKRGEGNIRDSKLIQGLIIDQRLKLDKMPRHLDSGKLLALSCPLKIESSSRDADIEIESAEKFAEFLQAEDRIIQEKVDKILATNATFIACKDEVDDSILQALAEAGCIVMADLEGPGLQDIADTCNAWVIDHLDDIDQANLGSFDSVDVEVMEGSEGKRERIHLVVGKSAGIVTLDVYGTDGLSSEEAIRALFDSLRSVCLATEYKSTMLGGGNFHSHAASTIRMAGEAKAGRQRLAMDAYSRALELIPCVLLENAGEDKLDGLLELRAKNNAKDSCFGVDSDGEISDVSTVRLCTETVLSGIILAFETATTLLRIDQVISSRGD